MRARFRMFQIAMCLLCAFRSERLSIAQGTPTAPTRTPTTHLAAALSSAEWSRVDQGINRALTWIAAQQQADGSFPTRDQGQPAITSLCVMAFLSAGHLPGEGPYGEALNRAIDFALKAQQETGLFATLPSQASHVHRGASHTAMYNHAITGLMLCEVYGQVSRERSVRMSGAIKRALVFTKERQLQPVKQSPLDEGGWRYLYHVAHSPSDSDLSITGWKLMFLRSAKNAQFEIEDKIVNSAVAYVERCFEPDSRTFVYGQVGVDRYTGRGLMGVGALALALAGKHDTDMARAAGDWILKNPFDTYGATTARLDRFHYSAYYCSNAMAQLGGQYWQQSFPPLAKTLLEAQSSEGFWAAEIGSVNEDAAYGPVYPTALSVLTLTPAYQLLPIYQR